MSNRGSRCMSGLCFDCYETIGRNHGQTDYSGENIPETAVSIEANTATDEASRTPQEQQEIYDPDDADLGGFQTLLQEKYNNIVLN